MLTDTEKTTAKELGLTQQEMRFAKAAHVAPERYARNKAEIAAERAADDAQMEAFAAAVTDQLQYAVRRPGGVGLPPEDGG